MKVWSLFDWKSWWQLALKKIKIKVDKYLASEIDKNAIKVTKKNFPNTIHMWDITQIDIEKYKWIDLLLWWSPCQWFSRAWKWLNFEDKRSKLFFEYVKILKTLKPKYFLLENVVMKKEWEDIISEHLFWIQPVKINSSYFSAQKRERLYWFWVLQDDWTYKTINLPSIEDKNILLKDILQKESEIDNISYIKDNWIILEKKEWYLLIKNATKKWYLEAYPWDCVDYSFPNSTTRRWRVKKWKSWTLVTAQNQSVVTNDLRLRKLTPIECERLQNLPDNYTSCVSDTERFRIIWNWWTIDVIAFILENLIKKY